MRDDHLPDAAILGVFLNDDDPSGFSHRFFNRVVVPWRDRTQINQLDARFVFDFCDRLERFLHRVAPGN